MKLKVIEVTVRARVRTHAVEEYVVRENASHWGEGGGQSNVDVPSSVHIYIWPGIIQSQGFGTKVNNVRF